MGSKPWRQVFWSLALAALVGLAATLMAQQPSAPPGVASGPRWSLAATGDSIITRRVSVYDDAPFLSMVKVIRDVDVAFNNAEITLFRLSEFSGYPQAEAGGAWVHGPPEMADELKWLGFDMFNRANNHTTDFGAEGMLETNRILDAAGLVHAGTGLTLGEATQAKYLETNKGRFALIGLATTFMPMSRAGEPRPNMKGRPGLNGLRLERTYQLDSDRMAEIRRVAVALGARVPQKEDQPLRFAGQTYVRGPETKVVERVNKIDEDRILRSVRNASKQANFVIVTSHSHEPGNDSPEPPAFLVEFAKKCIDNGADTYIVHGPHQLRGIEIYKGKPILFSVGNFIFQNETNEPMPSDMYETYGLGSDELAAELYDTRFKGGTTGFPASSVWFESVVAVPVFQGHQLVELKLYPIDLGYKLSPAERGTPRMAEGELAKKIIDRVAKLSAPFGTRIVLEGGIGVWQPGPAKTSSGR